MQNAVDPADLGTATSANNYFRQIGGSVGAAVFGTLFTNRLAHALTERLPAGAHLPDPESITPQLVHAMPPALRDGYIRAYADAMPRIFLYLVPVLVLGFVLAFFLKEKPLVSQNAPTAETHRPPPARPCRPRTATSASPAAFRSAAPSSTTTDPPCRAPPSPSSTYAANRSGAARAARTGGTR